VVVKGIFFPPTLSLTRPVTVAEHLGADCQPMTNASLN
jgi:hypothetical protein